MKSHSFKFAAGLNLFVQVSDESHNINLTDITLRNNGGTYGNLYMEVSALSSSYNLDNIRVNIQLTNVISIPSDTASFGPYSGLVVKYKIQLSHFDLRSSDQESSSLDPDYYVHPRSFREWLARILKWGNTNFWRKRVNILLENGYLVGSCMTIMDSVLSMDGSSIWFLFAMKNVTIVKSRCPTALSIVNSDLNSNVQSSDLTIINSRNDILLLDIASETSKLILTGDTSFSSNQGSVC